MSYRILQDLRNQFKKNKIPHAKEMDGIKHMTHREMVTEYNLILVGGSSLASRQRESIKRYIESGSQWKKKIRI